MRFRAKPTNQLVAAHLFKLLERSVEDGARASSFSVPPVPAHYPRARADVSLCTARFPPQELTMSS